MFAHPKMLAEKICRPTPTPRCPVNVEASLKENLFFYYFRLWETCPHAGMSLANVTRGGFQVKPRQIPVQYP